MLIDAPPTLSNTIMHHKHLSHLMAKNMNELAHKSPLIIAVISFRSDRNSSNVIGRYCWRFQFFVEETYH